MNPATATRSARSARKIGLIGTLDVATTAPLFDEHFRDFPVLPGSFSLALAIPLLLCGDGDRPPPQARRVVVRRARFSRPVAPGERLEVHRTELRCGDPGMTARIRLLDRQRCEVMDAVIAWEHAT